MPKLTKLARTRYRAAMDAVLADGEWHDRREVIDAGVPFVPAPQAVRRWRKSHNDERAKRRKRGVPHRPRGETKKSDTDGILHGARQVCSLIFAQEVRSKRWQKSADGKRVRIHPLLMVGSFRGACGLCGYPDARHRVYDAIQERVRAGEDPDFVATDYGIPVEFVNEIAMRSYEE